ncbi:MAG: type II toxin-antitoxin system HicB family antitoxin [Anaerolineae bacterium]|nr:type II toxin-antitoxin system HicB family antitoxin [Anaerolineae bacterium]
MEMVYNLRLTIEPLADGDYKYMATSPDLPNLIVAGDTIDEILADAPAVIRALLETMQETGQSLPETLKVEAIPYQANLPVAI